MARRPWCSVAVALGLVSGAVAGTACTTSSGPESAQGDLDSGADVAFDVTAQDSEPAETGADATTIPEAAIESGVAIDSAASADSGSMVDATAEASPPDSGHDAGIVAYTCPTPVPYNAGAGPQTPIVVDLTHDGWPDVAIVNFYDGTLGVFPNTGDAGTLGSMVPTQTANGSFPHEVRATDVNGDGWADLATTGSAIFTVHINTADGTGSLLPGVIFSYGPPGGDTLTFGDFNGDGLPDFAGTQLTGNSVALRLNQTTDAGLAFAPVRVYDAGLEPDYVATASLRGNQKLDLALATSCRRT